MKKGLKVFAVALLLLVVLLVGAVVALPWVISPDAFKPQIASALSQRTGHKVSIPGHIDLSVFPWLGLTIGQVHVANANGFGGGDLASVHNASVHIRLLPLVLHRRIVLGRLDLNGLRLNLKRNREGRTNWAGLMAKTSSGSTRNGGHPSAPVASHGGFRLPSLQVAGVAVRNALINWDDARADRHYQISDLSLTTGRLETGHQAKVDVAFNARSGQPAVDAHVQLVSTLTPGAQGQRITIGNLRLTVDAKGKGVPGGQQRLVVGGAGGADLHAGTASLSRLDVKAAGLSLTAALSATGLANTPQVKGHVAVAPFNPRQVMRNLGLKPPATADAKAFTQASLQSDVQASGGDVRLGTIKLDLDGSHLTGNAAIKGTKNPAIDFRLAVDRFNLDRYRAPAPTRSKTAGAAPKSAGTGSSSARKGKLPVAELRKLDMNGGLHVGKLQAMGAKLSNVQLTVDAHKGLVIIRPLSAALYGGRLDSDARIDARARPVYRINATLKGVHAGPLLHDVMGRDLLSGLAQFTLHLNSAGQTQAAMRRSLGGTLSFALRNGMIRGANVADLIRRGQALLRGQKPPPAQSQGTDFSSLTGTATIASGQMRNKDLKLLSPLLRVSGNGSVDLVRNLIDYNLDARVVKSLQGQGAQGGAVPGITVPLRVTGPLMSPHVSIDVAALTRQRLQGERKKLEDKVKSKAKQLKQRALDQLDKLFQ